jgi:phosphatidylglycerophosphatase A
MQTAALAKRVFTDPLYFLAFGFGSGLSPIAPGTCATLATIPLYLLLSHYTHWSVYLAITAFVFFFGIWLSERVCNELGVHDYPGVVWDEVAGYLLTMFLAPEGIFWVVLGFGLFRLFDIWKPQPIRWVDENMTGGLGVMLDDLLAAIPSWLVIQLIAWRVHL